MIDHSKVYRTARVLAGGGPDVSPAEARALVTDLRAQARRAPGIVASVTGLAEAAEQAASVEVKVVDRATWASAGAVSVENLLQGRDVVSTVEGSIVFSAVAAKVLGQFDPFSQPERLYLVAPNVASFRMSFDLDRRDLCLWVAVHEITHATQFAAAPWLKEVLAARAASLLQAFDSGADSEPAFGEVTAVMSLLEGHAEYAMNNVPTMRIPSRRRIISAMAAKRAGGNPIVAFLVRHLGLDAKTAQYKAGEAFVAHVVSERGMEFFNRVWLAPQNLPTLAELSDPAAWIERM
ncbi:MULTISPECIES: zinc-dependent metalloprotease [Trueperella]|uniref:Uncharacterized protein (DUF2342 family) n=1 Tax=Trueperella abortisuis TaxID=445930 RepID=A0ABT9PKA6_9ACTO|nr:MULTISPECIES: zinc-dependent metalloprotease [Trueperella]MDP9833157.1 uncharacterized protein (DUF2342 family) [Trueperella abortisuis]MDY5403474.1 zinc-dependent metalloprotease [Trueperella sp.]